LDARLNDYEFYSCLDYNVYLALNGDCLDRYFLRFNEMVESCRLIYSLLLFLFSSSFLFSLFTPSLFDYFSNSFNVPNASEKEALSSLLLSKQSFLFSFAGYLPIEMTNTGPHTDRVAIKGYKALYN